MSSSNRLPIRRKTSAAKTRTPRTRTVKKYSSGRNRFFTRGKILSLLAGVFLMLSVLFAGVYYVYIRPLRISIQNDRGTIYFPENYNIRGIDVSRYQGDINWEVLRNASLNNDPIRFVFIKSTEGVSLIDVKFNKNFYQAKKNDFIRGAYHFYLPNEDPKKQATFFINQTQLEPGDLPPVLDVEKRGFSSEKQFRQDILTWLRIVEKHYGVKPILYTYFKFKKQHLSDPVFNEYPYWIAHYNVPELSYKGKWAFWQHSDRGRVDGITGDVDCNIFNGSEQDLLNLTIK